MIEIVIRNGNYFFNYKKDRIMKRYLLPLFIIGASLLPAMTTPSRTCAGKSDLSIEISFDSASASINHEPPPSLFSVTIDDGSIILIRGYVYPRGTWATDPNCFTAVATGCMCGTNPPTGNPDFPNNASFPSKVIGEIACTGNFFLNPFTIIPPPNPPNCPSPTSGNLGTEIGLFFLNIKFGGDDSNMLELRGRTLVGFDGSNPARFSVLGGTGIFKRAKGEALEIMIRSNFSGAFNFVIDLNEIKHVPMGKLRELISG